MGIALETYNRQDFEQQLEPLSPNQRGGRAYAGLSPFGLPQGVEARIGDDDTCMFVFSYPDQEPPSWRPVAVAGSPWLEVRLGQESKRILALTIHDASKHLSEGTTSFDSRLAFEWCRNSPERVVNSCTRNANVVAAILERLPQTFRERLVEEIGLARNRHRQWWIHRLFRKR